MRFSIIVPCCEAVPYLETAIRSVREQTFTDFECLLIYETSRDHTLDFCREAAGGDSRFVLYTEEKSGSPATPRNTGLAHARGEYILFLDSDDWLSSEALALLDRTITLSGPADFISFAWKSYRDDGDCRPHFQKRHFLFSSSDHGRKMSGREMILLQEHRRNSGEHCYMPAVWTGLCRRAFLERHRLRFVPGLVHEDEEWMPRILFLAEKTVILNEALYHYRIRPNSMITSGRGGDLRGIARGLQSLFGFYAAHEVPREIARTWQRHWLGDLLFFHFFYPDRIKRSDRNRLDALKIIFATPEAVRNFRKFVWNAPLPQKIGAALILLVSLPGMLSSDLPARLYFCWLYYPLRQWRENKR